MTKEATYKEIQRAVKKEQGFVPKTCWIAHIKYDYGLITRPAPNRAPNGERKYPCPPEKRPMIEQTMRRLGVFDDIL